MKVYLVSRHPDCESYWIHSVHRSQEKAMEVVYGLQERYGYDDSSVEEMELED